MRTVTAGETTTLGLASKRITLRVKIANGSGTMIDYSDWVESVAIEQDVDQPVGGATVFFGRASSATQSLAPLRTDSTLNRLDDLVTYSPAIDINRSITIEVATTDIGAAILAGDYKLLFKGTVDIVNFEMSPISIECRDLGAPLVDRWVESVDNYGSLVGVAIQTVMQEIIDDVFGAAVHSLYTPSAPGFNISPAYQQQTMSVMDALQDLAQMIGWDVRYKWDNGTSTFRLTFSVPDRAKTVPDWTFGPSQYIGFSRLSLDATNIRNVVTIDYRNSLHALGNRARYTATDAPSITKYGRKFFFIQEADTSPIDTPTEAQTMAESALADLKEPKADLEVEMPFFWPVELGDLFRFSDNDVTHDTNQDLAVVEIKHELSANRHRTKLRVRGSPIGQYMTWLGRGGTTTGTMAFPPQAFIEFLDGDTDNLSWNLRFTATAGSGGGGTNLTYTITSKRGADATTTVDSGDESDFPSDLVVLRDPRYDKVITFTLFDAATGLTAVEILTVPAQTENLTDAGLVPGGKLVATSVPGTSLQNAAVGPTKVESRFRARAYRTANQSIPDITATEIAWQAEFFDVGGVGGGTGMTIPAGGDTGVWLLSAQVVFASNATGYRSVTITNTAAGTGSKMLVPAVNGEATVVNLSHIESNPVVGDVIKLAVFQNSGGALNVTGGSNLDTWFSAVHLW